MSKILAEFVRVSRRQPCPVCGRTDWCLVAREDPPSKAFCQRVESPKRCGEAGWLHRLHDGPVQRIEQKKDEAAVPFRCSAGWSALVNLYHAQVQSGMLFELAHNLGVTVDSLHALWIGWTGEAWAFPMANASDDIVGIRLRSRDGKKYAVRGGHNGLFIPTGHIAARGPTLIVEGPTEAATALDLGFGAVGRPSCSACVLMTVEYLRLLAIRRGSPVDAVIVANRDKVKINPVTGKRFWPGQRGAGVLFRALLSACRSVRVIMPPRGIKDLRDWKRAGLTRDELLDVIDQARQHGSRRPQRLAVMK